MPQIGPGTIEAGIYSSRILQELVVPEQPDIRHDQIFVGQYPGICDVATEVCLEAVHVLRTHIEVEASRIAFGE